MEDFSNIDHGRTKKNYEKAIRKAERGDVDTMLLLGRAYSSGEYLPKDYLAAEAWLRKAAELDCNEAKKELAVLLNTGKGVARDYEEAFDWNHDLMMDCDVDGMMAVGIAYKLGRGIWKDERQGSLFIKHAFNIGLDLMDDEEKPSDGA